MGAIDNLERQARRERINTYLRSRARRNSPSRKKKFSIREAIKLGMPPLLMNKGGIVARTKSKFKGHF